MNTLTSLKAPISVNFETTQVCNLRCNFCFSNSARYFYKNPPLKSLKRVIDALAEAEVFEIRWFGGEFTALKGWEEVVAYAFDRDFFMAFVSNGTLITREAAKPRINCRFRIRKDLEGYIGFFKDRGILTFDETAARIVQLIDG